MNSRRSVLLTGDRGYIGSVMSELLDARGFRVVGYDTGYFADCLLEAPFETYPRVTRDIRDLRAEDLRGFDAVVHLAGLSNDPLGELDTGLTEQINFTSTIRLAQLAREARVKRFVYASSQSMYGISNSDAELDEIDSEKNAITAYARTKWQAEQQLHAMGSEDFVVVSLRPSTVFGASPRLRCDIVYNNFVACSYTTGKIEIKSDGTPWRPVVHVRDVCAAFLAGLEAPADKVAGKAFNVGIADGNFTVRQLADAAGRAVPGCKVVYTGEHGRDARTYRVSFRRILTELADWYRPEWTLERGAEELVALFKRSAFDESQFRGRMTNRLAQLKYLQGGGYLAADLRWRHA